MIRKHNNNVPPVFSSVNYSYKGSGRNKKTSGSFLKIVFGIATFSLISFFLISIFHFISYFKHEEKLSLRGNNFVRNIANNNEISIDITAADSPKIDLGSSSSVLSEVPKRQVPTGNPTYSVVSEATTNNVHSILDVTSLDLKEDKIEVYEHIIVPSSPPTTISTTTSPISKPIPDEKTSPTISKTKVKNELKLLPFDEPGATCDGGNDPFEKYPIETFVPPSKAPRKLIFEWRNAVDAMKTEISKLQIGGDPLRMKIKEEITKLTILRLDLFCEYL